MARFFLGAKNTFSALEKIPSDSWEKPVHRFCYLLAGTRGEGSSPFERTIFLPEFPFFKKPVLEFSG